MLIKLDGNFRCCAFCIHWYDPTNSHISPHAPQHNMWKFDEKAKCKCLISGLEKPGNQRCDKYECKL